MKRILRVIIVSIFLLFTWPYFLYKKYGNIIQKIEGRTVIISNHYSTFDPFFIYLLYFKKKITFATIIDAKKKLLSRFVTWLFDCVYINYETNNIQFVKKCLKLLQADGILCIYPEGFINPRKFGFLEFYKSYLLLSEKTKSSILPIYIYPELRPFKRTKLYIGDIISYEEYMKYPDYEERNAYFQGLIMDYSFKVSE